MTVCPPQVTVSVSPANAPVPVRPTTTGVPSAASPALMPPPPFSAIVIDGAVGATVSTVTEIAVELMLVLPATSVSRAVTSNVPSPCAVIVAAGTATVALPARMSLPVNA